MLISSPMAWFSEKAAAKKIATTATHNQPHTKANCGPQDLYPGAGEVTGVVPILPGVLYLLLRRSLRAESFRRETNHC